MFPFFSFEMPDRTSTFAYQAIAEVSYSLSEDVDLVASYRYMGASEFDFIYADVSTPTPGFGALVEVNDLSTSTISAGLRFGL